MLSLVEGRPVRAETVEIHRPQSGAPGPPHGLPVRNRKDVYHDRTKHTTLSDSEKTWRDSQTLVPSFTSLVADGLGSLFGRWWQWGSV